MTRIDRSYFTLNINWMAQMVNRSMVYLIALLEYLCCDHTMTTHEVLKSSTFVILFLFHVSESVVGIGIYLYCKQCLYVHDI